MTIDELKTQLKWLVMDPTVEKNLEYLIADERLSFAAEYELPALRLHQPFSGEVTTGQWLYDLPDSYQKKVFKARNGDPNGSYLPIHRRIGTIERMDFAHTETETYVSSIAIEDRHMAIYPKANDTVLLWFYEKPDVADDITEIPDEFVFRTLVPRIVLRCFKVYPELAREAISENPKALDLWRTRQSEGLYGSRHTGEVGFLNTLLKSNPPRRRGGRDQLP